MSPTADRFPAATQTLRTRVVMGGIFAGALIALALSVVFSWSSGITGGPVEAPGRKNNPARTCMSATFTASPTPTKSET